MIKLSDVRLNESNPRYIKDDQFEKLVKSIRDFPRMLELRPIVIDGDGVIVGGNMRYRALLEIGYSEVDDSWVKQAADFTPEELREFVIKDNLPFGDWDWEELANSWDVEELSGWGLEIPDLAGDDVGEGQEEDEQELEKLLDEVGKIESRVKLGEIWQLGRHKICCGDSTVESNVRALLGDRFGDVGMVWADPPYNTKQQQGRTSSQWGVIENDSLTDQDFSLFAQSFADILSKINPSSLYVCCHWKSYPVFFSLLPDINSLIVWVKNNFGLGSGYRPKHELIIFRGKIESNSESNVWEISKDAPTNYQHPMQKPVELIEKAFINSSDFGDLIFDPFLGSAPSIIAAQKMEGDRTVYGFELSPDYCTVILSRWENFTGLTAKLIGNL